MLAKQRKVKIVTGVAKFASSNSLTVEGADNVSQSNLKMQLLLRARNQLNYRLCQKIRALLIQPAR